LVKLFEQLFAVAGVLIVLFIFTAHHKYTYQCTALHPKYGTRCKLKPMHAKNAFVTHVDFYGRRWR
jgi:hypothetical protein